MLGSFCHLHKYTIVDLEQAEELKDLARFRCDFIDTPDTNDKVDLRLGGHVKVASGTGSTSEADLFLLLGLIFFYVGLCALEDYLALRFSCLMKSKYSEPR